MGATADGKKRKNSRNKGSGFERVVADALSKAFGMELRRTPLSGGWSRGNPNVAGDIVNVDPEKDFPFCVECKHVEGWQLESLFTDKHQWFDVWWKQLMDECPTDKIPLLVFTRNRVPAFVALPYKSVVAKRYVSTRLMFYTDEQTICIYEFNVFVNFWTKDQEV